ncbi:unnamed protein product [Lepidochelys kempii]
MARVGELPRLEVSGSRGGGTWESWGGGTRGVQGLVGKQRSSQHAPGLDWVGVTPAWLPGGSPNPPRPVPPPAAPPPHFPPGRSQPRRCSGSRPQPGMWGEGGGQGGVNGGGDQLLGRDWPGDYRPPSSWDLPTAGGAEVSTPPPDAERGRRRLGDGTDSGCCLPWPPQRLPSCWGWCCPVPWPGPPPSAPPASPCPTQSSCRPAPPGPLLSPSTPVTIGSCCWTRTRTGSTWGPATTWWPWTSTTSTGSRSSSTGRHPRVSRAPATWRGRGSGGECFNYVRLVEPLNRTHLYACGTGACQPVCALVHRGWRSQEYLFRMVPWSLEPGKGALPVRPPSEQPGHAPDGTLYAGLHVDFMGTDAALFRTMGPRPAVRTERHDSRWLHDPVFLRAHVVPDSSERGDDKLYFFFREKALEGAVGPGVLARVGRVCLNDDGGQRALVGKWTTFLKARLVCSVVGEDGVETFFDELRDVFLLPTQDEKNPRVYGLFSTLGSVFRGSAVCMYPLSAIRSAFNGPFAHKEGHSYEWVPYTGRVPYPRPGACPGGGLHPGAGLHARVPGRAGDVRAFAPADVRPRVPGATPPPAGPRRPPLRLHHAGRRPGAGGRRPLRGALPRHGPGHGAESGGAAEGPRRPGGADARGGGGVQGPSPSEDALDFLKAAPAVCLLGRGAGPAEPPSLWGLRPGLRRLLPGPGPPLRLGRAPLHPLQAPPPGRRVRRQDIKHGDPLRQCRGFNAQADQELSEQVQFGVEGGSVFLECRPPLPPRPGPVAPSAGGWHPAPAAPGAGSPADAPGGPAGPGDARRTGAGYQCVGTENSYTRPLHRLLLRVLPRGLLGGPLPPRLPEPGGPAPPRSRAGGPTTGPGPEPRPLDPARGGPDRRRDRARASRRPPPRN